MEQKKIVVSSNTITRNIKDVQGTAENVYESINIISKRADQISREIKVELNRKLEEFASYTDNLEEIFENREQIEISKHYEKQPKPVLIATTEMVNGELPYKRSED